jgi:hypothetical protein
MNSTSGFELPDYNFHWTQQWTGLKQAVFPLPICLKIVLCGSLYPSPPLETEPDPVSETLCFLYI